MNKSIFVDSKIDSDFKDLLILEKCEACVLTMTALTVAIYLSWLPINRNVCVDKR